MTPRRKPDAPASDGGEPTPTRRADAIRNQAAIAEAAVRVLAEQPGASMAEIADASGLGRATLYRHFSTRAELVEAIQRQAVEAAGKAIAACGLEGLPAPLALERAIRALLGVGDRYSVLVHEATLDPRMLERQQAVAGPVLATVLRGQESGELRRDLPAPWILRSMANLIVLARREIAAGRLTSEDAGALVAGTLLRGVAASPP